MAQRKLNVLVACESSGRVREAFRKLGHNAWSCDLLPCDVKSRYHIQGDVLEVIKSPMGRTGCMVRQWDMMIAHPPCTYLANSGVSWLYKRGTNLPNQPRWDAMQAGAKFFIELMNADIPMIAVENPIMHRHAKAIGIPRQSQVIQPWMFGHTESKATCLWLKGLPLLKRSRNVKAKMLTLPNSKRQRLHWLPPGPKRWKMRSKTFSGIALAMAKQWSQYVLDEPN